MKRMIFVLAMLPSTVGAQSFSPTELIRSMTCAELVGLSDAVSATGVANSDPVDLWTHGLAEGYVTGYTDGAEATAQGDGISAQVLALCSTDPDFRFADAVSILAMPEEGNGQIGLQSRYDLLMSQYNLLDQVLEYLEGCTTMTNEAERLSCYDRPAELIGDLARMN